MENFLQSNTSDDDMIEVKLFDEPERKIKEGYPDILNHPQHYKGWLKPSRAQVQVVCHQTVLDRIQQHANSYPTQEIGGILVGQYSRYQESGYVEISTYLPAPPEGGGQNSVAHFTFTETIWAEMLRDKDRNPALDQMEIVGWFHSHPNWGTHPSSLDIDIQREHFSYEWQVALIYDPYRHEGDFYIWDNEALVRAPGFYEVFSRVRPKPITDWKNYLQIEQLQREHLKNRQKEKSSSEQDGTGQQPNDGTQRDGNNAHSRSSNLAVPLSDLPFHPDQDNISITRDDLWRNVLRRNWNELLLVGLLFLMIPFLGYLAYEAFNAPQDELIAGPPELHTLYTTHVEQKRAAQMSAVDDYRADDGMWFEVHDQKTNKAINISTAAAASTFICVHGSQYDEALNQADLLVLVMDSTTGLARSKFVTPHQLELRTNNIFCPVYDLSQLAVGSWQGKLYVVRPGDNTSGLIGSQPGPLEPLETFFKIRLFDNAGEDMGAEVGVADE